MIFCHSRLGEHKTIDEDGLFNLYNRLVSDMHTYIGENIYIANHVHMRETVKSALWLELTVAIVKGSRTT